jgi:hypothetical protein
MTTNPKKRKQYWENQHSGLSRWSQSGPYSSRAAAQKAEKQLAAKKGCEAHGGGRSPKKKDAKWYVYNFNH